MHIQYKDTDGLKGKGRKKINQANTSPKKAGMVKQLLTDSISSIMELQRNIHNDKRVSSSR